MIERKKVLLVYCEVRGAPLKKEGFAGAFVTCFVPSSSIEEALHKSRRALNQDGYDIVDIDRVLAFDPAEWAHEPLIFELADAASNTDKLLYSDFEAYGH